MRVLKNNQMFEIRCLRCAVLISSPLMRGCKCDEDDLNGIDADQTECPAGVMMVADEKQSDIGGPCRNCGCSTVWFKGLIKWEWTHKHPLGGFVRKCLGMRKWANPVPRGVMMIGDEKLEK